MGNLDDLSATRSSGIAPSAPGPLELGIRRARSRCRITMLASTTASIASNTLHKGDVLATARVAGVQAVKQATSLLPMSQSVSVSNVYIDFTICDTHIDVEASVDTLDRTGVEMGALAAVTVAALTVYDMCKSVDRSMTIGEVTLWEKSGSGEGTWRREDPSSS